MRGNHFGWTLTVLFAGTFAWAQTPAELGKIAGWKGTAPNSSDAFSFVILSDRTGDAQPGQWEAGIRQANLLRPDFVMCVGDLIEGYTEDQADLTGQWDAVEATIAQLDAPFFYCPGNHDTSNALASKVYTQRHGVDGHPYYSFNYRACHFVVLDSNTAGRDDKFAAEQLAWVQKDLAAAKDAQHVFVFYHQPSWDNPKLWPALRQALPAGKTTVFNGDWHRLTYQEADGIPTYVLASTAAENEDNRVAGQLHMVARVVVDQGKATITWVPLGEVLSAKYAQYTAAASQLLESIKSDATVPLDGGTYVFRQTNPFDQAIFVQLKWGPTKWDLTPKQTAVSIAGHRSGSKEFVLKPLGGEHPVLTAIYTLPPFEGLRPAPIKREIRVAACAELPIPHVAGMTIDGDLSDWAAVEPLKVTDENRLLAESQGWNGPKDASYLLRAATDGQTLFLSVDVSDDQICVDAPNPWENDTLEFFWDARAEKERDGKTGPGTGQLFLPVPAAGAPLATKWSMGDRPEPKGLAAAHKRRDGGYIMEWSIPLSEVGLKVPATGQALNLEVQLDDRDIVDGKPVITRMTSNGAANSYQATGSYIRCTFK